MDNKVKDYQIKYISNLHVIYRSKQNAHFLIISTFVFKVNSTWKLIIKCDELVNTHATDRFTIKKKLCDWYKLESKEFFETGQFKTI